MTFGDWSILCAYALNIIMPYYRLLFTISVWYRATQIFEILGLFCYLGALAFLLIVMFGCGSKLSDWVTGIIFLVWYGGAGKGSRDSCFNMILNVPKVIN